MRVGATAGNRQAHRCRRADIEVQKRSIYLCCCRLWRLGLGDDAGFDDRVALQLALQHQSDAAPSSAALIAAM